MTRPRMSEMAAVEARSQGRDATHRTRNLDTHLTHGCITVFRHFLRVLSDYTLGAPAEIHGF